MPKSMNSVPTMKRRSGSHAIARTPKIMQRMARIGLVIVMPIFLRLLSKISVIFCFHFEFVLGEWRLFKGACVGSIDVL